ncbi:Glycosyl transferase family 2 [Cribrihabitans marinus]|uniref:Glycosyl transferase family 2 n=1 Tax=Cribrihabitans marinus TaxID=1227549 RepID=A0A1H6T3V6_9RHOB|nr:glycosyltransferase family 2 protein [Cribrihabitans marinus]GGH22639.1 hypothetical protein GCM10010973_08080 [Cribrihabitans marinus]SEI72794.1 Glycosyl transferase family 2 [Cribrihabitans marinus]
MKICAITMVYRDHWALGQWFAHHARHLGPENLFIVAHGADPALAGICPGANIMTIPRDDLSEFDARRERMLNAFQSGLCETYDWVIRTDADELICFDPARHSGFADIFEARPELALFALGLNLAERPQDPPLESGMSALAHRNLAQFSGHYSKAWAVRRRIGLRRHGVEVRPRFTKGFRFAMPRGVYLVHLKYACSEALLAANPHRRAIASGPGAGLPGAAWQSPDLRAQQFYERIGSLPVMPWDEAEDSAYRQFSDDPVRLPNKGLVRVRDAPVDVATTLPDWFSAT